MERLIEYAKQYGLIISEVQIRQFELYYETLIRWNEKVNLTAITEANDVAMKHFIDSIVPLGLIGFPQSIKILDVGTGAGFPSLPLKIMRPDLNLVLLDSLRKRIHFLMETSILLGQNNEFIHGRAEDHGGTDLRESFMYAVSRAVAPLNVLTELVMPFLEIDGSFIAWKGGEAEKEVSDAQIAIEILGGQVIDMKRYDLPNGNRRSIIVIKKISHTPTNYPRKPANIKKKPL